MTKLDGWVRADKEGEGGVRCGVPHEVGFVVNLDDDDDDDDNYHIFINTNSEEWGST